MAKFPTKLSRLLGFEINLKMTKSPRLDRKVFKLESYTKNEIQHQTKSWLVCVLCGDLSFAVGDDKVHSPSSLISICENYLFCLNKSIIQSLPKLKSSSNSKFMNHNVPKLKSNSNSNFMDRDVPKLKLSSNSKLTMMSLN